MEYKYKNSIEEFNKGNLLIPEGIKGMHKINTITDYPSYFVKGKGAYVWDLDGNQYIDYVMGKGTNILGHCHSEVDKAVKNQIENGNVFPMANPLHNQLAGKINKLVPTAKKILFYRTGTCATSAAVRLARAYTGKKIILSSGYHGWQDWSNSGDGIPDEISRFFYDFEYSLDKLESLLDTYKNQIAAVIITPEEEYFEVQYYTQLEKICKNSNVLMILDEVKSGFRVSLGGFQKKYNLNPDLSVFSKALSNGYAISAVVGKEEIMDVNAKLHTAGTYDVETISFAAAIATLETIENENVIPSIYEKGKYLTSEFERIFRKYNIGIYPVFSSGSFRFWCKDENIERNFYMEMAKEGVLFYSFDNSFISGAHEIKILDETIERAEKVVRDNLVEFHGTYEGFSLEDIGNLKNKKGFLNRYPGRDGRRWSK